MDNIIVLATSNKNKLKEMQNLLKDFPVTIKSLADFGPMPEAIEDGETFDDNAYKKALPLDELALSEAGDTALGRALAALGKAIQKRESDNQTESPSDLYLRGQT